MLQCPDERARSMLQDPVNKRRQHMKLRTALATIVILLASLASAGAATVQIIKTPHGRVFANDKGMTLYTFDKDGTGASSCAWLCTIAWPPALAPSTVKPTRNWSVIKRDSGASQWAYRGRPLYTYIKDARRGDTTGDGVEGVWHAARP
jgi:predicted lipoprotein with Yx(FWY)xxD motif